MCPTHLLPPVAQTESISWGTALHPQLSRLAVPKGGPLQAQTPENTGLKVTLCAGICRPPKGPPQAFQRHGFEE